MGRRSRHSVWALLGLLAAIGGESAAFAQQGGASVITPRRILLPLRPVARPTIQPIALGARGTDPAPDRLRTDRPPPAGVGPSGLLLKRRGYADLIHSVPVIRQWSASQLQLNPRIDLGSVKVDLTPLLTRDGALTRVAQRLQSEPQLAQINFRDVQVSQIPQGLVIRSFVNYRIAPGACRDQRRSSLDLIGLHCVRRIGIDAAALSQTYATVGDVHYVADPGRRAAAVQAALRNSKIEAAEIDKHVSALRSTLANPAQAQALAAQIGAAQVQHLSALSDDDLAAELIDTAETKIEQTVYVPVALTLRSATPSLSGLAVRQPAEAPAPVNVVTNTALKPVIYLTGFTLGHHYEWDQRVETTIDWCLVSCSETYYVHVFAHFDYGFGLRLPIRLGGNYHYERAGNGEQATYTPDFAPFDGSPTDYAATGLEPDKIYSGKEFVAQAGAGIGFEAHIPVLPDPPNVNIDVSKDFTNLLPAPFTNGQFAPPTAGQSTPSGQFIFDQFDLLAGRLNFGILGAQVFPALEVQLLSGSLTFDFHDNVNPANSRQLAVPGIGTPIGVDAKSHSSDFTIDNPTYNLSVLLTPGIDPRLFLDLAVWSDHWDFPIWFPELSIQVPKDGVNFKCHADTKCSNQFTFATLGTSTETGPGAAALGKLMANIEAWGLHVDTDMAPRCKSGSCKLALGALRADSVQRMEMKVKAADPNSTDSIKAVSDEIQADKHHYDALGYQILMIDDMQAWGPDFDGRWLPRCYDDNCRFGVRLVRTSIMLQIKQFIGALDVSGKALLATPIEATKAKAEQAAASLVQESTVKQSVKATDAIAALAKAVWTKQCKDSDCLGEVAEIAGRMTPRSAQMAMENSGMTSFQISGAIGKEFGPQFQAAIDRSGVRSRVAAIGELAEAAWLKQCADPLCRSNVEVLVGRMLTRARALQISKPEISSVALSGAMGKEFGPQFQNEIDASKMRASRPVLRSEALKQSP